MSTNTTQADAATLKGLLDVKSDRREQVESELNPLRDTLAKLRTAAQFKRGNSAELNRVKGRVWELEGELAVLNKQIEDLASQWKARRRWESGQVHEEIRRQIKNFF